MGADNVCMSQETTSAAAQKLQEFYASNRFQEGIDLLLETKDQWQSGRFHELLGSFHLKMDHYAVARYHLELALKKGNITGSVQHNLDFVLQQLGMNSSYNSTWFERFVDSLSLWPFEIWAALTLVLLALSIWKIGPRWRSGKRSLVIVLWLLALVPQGIYWGIFQYRVSAIALEDTPLHEGPSALFESVKTLRAGEKVIIEEGSDGWSFIGSPRVWGGWVKSEKLGFLGRDE